MKKLSLIAAALFVLAAVPASAQLWSMAGSSGIIDESSLNLFEFSGAQLRFKPGATGTIVARYPITQPIQNPGWGSMTIGYAGPGVTVKLIEVFDCLQFQQVITTFNNPNAVENNICEGHIYGPFTWDFASHAYYVEVTLQRSTTATNPAFNQIRFP